MLNVMPLPIQRNSSLDKRIPTYIQDRFQKSVCRLKDPILAVPVLLCLHETLSKDDYTCVKVHKNMSITQISVTRGAKCSFI